MNGEAVHMDCVGLIQMTSGPNPESNLGYLAQEIVKCKELGAGWVVCPETHWFLAAKQTITNMQSL